METIVPTEEVRALVNEQRRQVAAAMGGECMLALPGPCSPDLNRVDTGELAAVRHGMDLARNGGAATGSLTVVRYVAEKPRTGKGFTGIIHEEGGLEAYLEGASQLHAAGVPLASEVMSDACGSLVVPRLTIGWIGAREVSATGPRYSMRPTSRDLDRGVHPLPVFVKNDQRGGLTHTINAIETIMSDEPRSRTRIELDGLRTERTHANPHVGIILRGYDGQPDGDVYHALGTEITTAREAAKMAFGDVRVPIVVDISHAHAKWAGGGEAGQLAIAEALMGLMREGVHVDGWMGETYILPGKQAEKGTEAGRSITDPCIGQENAERLQCRMDEVATEVKQREPALI